ncbi:MAG: LrgB family protein [Bacteroidales bacterium]|nr:LrgB family protein [Bacteroidales bacterium]
MANEFFLNVPVMLALTIGAYLLGTYIKDKSGMSLLHPFLICIPTIVAVLYFTGVPCSFYMEANRIIEFMLGPSVVALGLLLYDHVETIKKNAVPIFVSVFSGSVTGVGSVWLLCRFFGLDEIFVRSLEPKSVTTPIAMDLAASLGGNVSLTAVSVVLCGFIGAVFGPLFLRLFRIGNPVSRGLALGCSAHGLGTSRAIETGAVEGAVSGLAIALMGLMTALVIPLFNMLFPV